MNTRKSSNHSNMPNLPQEIIIDILTRLPAKLVGQLRILSKQWKTILSEPQFIKDHNNNVQTKLKYEEESQSLIVVCNNSLYSIALINANNINNHGFHDDNITLVATKLAFADHLFTAASIYATAYCNGLVLVADEKCKLSLINPVTKEVKQLPRLSCFDPYSHFFPSFGIGYDSVSDDYKVVVFCSMCIDKRIVNVYSVRNGMWKQVESSPNNDCFIGASPSGVYFDGYLHWLSISNGYGAILAFDLHEEKFHQVPTPSLLVGFLSNENFNVVMVGGCLGVRFVNKWTTFWRMEEYEVKESWTKHLIIAPKKHKRLRHVCFIAKEKVLLTEFGDGLTGNSQLVMCNWKDGTCKNIVVLGMSGKVYVGQTIVENLVSPHGCKV